MGRSYVFSVRPINICFQISLPFWGYRIVSRPISGFLGPYKILLQRKVEGRRERLLVCNLLQLFERKE